MPFDPANRLGFVAIVNRVMRRQTDGNTAFLIDQRIPYPVVHALNDLKLRVRITLADHRQQIGHTRRVVEQVVDDQHKLRFHAVSNLLNFRRNMLLPDQQRRHFVVEPCAGRRRHHPSCRTFKQFYTECLLERIDAVTNGCRSSKQSFRRL